MSSSIIKNLIITIIITSQISVFLSKSIVQLRDDPIFEKVLNNNEIFEFTNTAKYKVIKLETNIENLKINLNSRAGKYLQKIEVNDSTGNLIIGFDQEKIYSTEEGRIFTSDAIKVASKEKGIKYFTNIYFDQNKIVETNPSIPSVKLQIYFSDFSVNEHVEVLTYDPTKSLSLNIPIAAFQNQSLSLFIIDVSKYGLEKFCQTSQADNVQKLTTCAEKDKTFELNSNSYGVFNTLSTDTVISLKATAKDAAKIGLTDFKEEDFHDSENGRAYFSKTGSQNLVLLKISLKSEVKKDFYESKVILNQPPTIIELNSETEVINSFSLEPKGLKTFAVKSSQDLTAFNIYHYTSNSNLSVLVSYSKIPYVNIETKEGKEVSSYQNYDEKLSLGSKKLAQLRVNELKDLPVFITLISSSSSTTSEQVQFSTLLTKNSYYNNSATNQLVNYINSYYINPSAKGVFFLQNSNDSAQELVLYVGKNEAKNTQVRYSSSVITSISDELFKAYSLDSTNIKTLSSEYTNLVLKPKESLVVELTNNDSSISIENLKIDNYSVDANPNFLKGIFIKTKKSTPKQYTLSLTNNVEYYIAFKALSLSDTDSSTITITIDTLNPITLNKDTKSGALKITNASKLNISTTSEIEDNVIYILLSPNQENDNNTSKLYFEDRRVNNIDKSGIITRYIELSSDSITNTSVDYKLSFKAVENIKFTSLTYRLSTNKDNFLFFSTELLDNKPSLIEESNSNEVFLSFSNIKKITFLVLRLGVKLIEEKKDSKDTDFKNGSFSYLVTSQNQVNMLKKSSSLSFELFSTKKIIVSNPVTPVENYKDYILIQILKPNDDKLKCQVDFDDAQLADKSFSVEKSVETKRIKNTKDLTKISISITCLKAHKTETQIFLAIALVDKTYENAKLQPAQKNYAITLTKNESSTWINVQYEDLETFLLKTSTIKYYFIIENKSVQLNAYLARLNFNKIVKYSKYEIINNKVKVNSMDMELGTNYNSIVFAIDNETKIIGDYESSIVQYKEIKDSSPSSTDAESSEQEKSGTRWYIIFIIIVVIVIGLVGLIFGIKYCMNQRRRSNQVQQQGLLGHLNP